MAVYIVAHITHIDLSKLHKRLITLILSSIVQRSKRDPVDGGDIQHTVATFLIGPDGEIEQRYLGSGTLAATLKADLEALL